jgi:hypothetical protein
MARLAPNAGQETGDNKGSSALHLFGAEAAGSTRKWPGRNPAYATNLSSLLLSRFRRVSRSTLLPR